MKIIGISTYTDYERNFKRKIPHAVGMVWQEIWDKDAELNRTYLYDYELYTEKTQQGDNSEVEIFVGVAL